MPESPFECHSVTQILGMGWIILGSSKGERVEQEQYISIFTSWWQELRSKSKVVLV